MKWDKIKVKNEETSKCLCQVAIDCYSIYELMQIYAAGKDENNQILIDGKKLWLDCFMHLFRCGYAYTYPLVCLPNPENNLDDIDILEPRQNLKKNSLSAILAISLLIKFTFFFRILRIYLRLNIWIFDNCELPTFRWFSTLHVPPLVSNRGYFDAFGSTMLMGYNRWLGNTVASIFERQMTVFSHTIFPKWQINLFLIRQIFYIQIFNLKRLQPTEKKHSVVLIMMCVCESGWY